MQWYGNDRHSPTHLREVGLLDETSRLSNEFRLKINTRKAKVMTKDIDKSTLIKHAKVPSRNIEQGTRFKYPGPSLARIPTVAKK